MRKGIFLIMAVSAVISMFNAAWSVNTIAQM